MKRCRTLCFIAGATLSLLTGCGGGSSSRPASTTTPSPTPAPSTTAQAAQGTITGFGSVFVNEVEWETDNCEITVDDEAGDEADLAVGDIVEVQGEIDDEGIARCTHLEHDAEVKGVISEVGANYIVVLGLRIEVDNDTVFDDDLGNGGFANLSVGNFVEVSAFATESGYLATRIDVEDDEGEFELRGVVDNLQTADNTFQIDGVTIDYSSADLQDFDGQPIASGDAVEVEGDTTGADGVLIATKVELEHSLFDDRNDGDEFELEGYLMVNAESGALSISGNEFAIADDAVFENGTRDDLVAGVKLEVEGDVDADGELIADDVEYKFEANVKVEGPLDAAPSAMLLAVLGIEFTATDSTRFEDDSRIAETFFDLGDLQAGDWLEIKAFQDSAGNLIATSIERDDDDNEVQIEAPLDRVDDGDLIVLGVRVLIGPETEIPVGFADVASFLDSLAPGVRLEIEGSAQALGDGFEILAREVELDDEEDFREADNDDDQDDDEDDDEDDD